MTSLTKISGVFETRNEVATWHGTVIGETAKAYKVSTGHSKGRVAWVAKSQVNAQGLVSEWLARRLYEEGKVQLFECTAFRTW